jgi:hypothetical protein
MIFKYVSLRADGSWRVATDDGLAVPLQHRVTPTNDANTVVRTKLSEYLLGQGFNQEWFNDNWTREQAYDCIENPELYRRD